MSVTYYNILHYYIVKATMTEMIMEMIKGVGKKKSFTTVSVKYWMIAHLCVSTSNLN